MSSFVPIHCFQGTYEKGPSSHELKTSDQLGNFLPLLNAFWKGVEAASKASQEPVERNRQQIEFDALIDGVIAQLGQIGTRAVKRMTLQNILSHLEAQKRLFLSTYPLNEAEKGDIEKAKQDLAKFQKEFETLRLKLEKLSNRRHLDVPTLNQLHVEFLDCKKRLEETQAKLAKMDVETKFDQAFKILKSEDQKFFLLNGHSGFFEKELEALKFQTHPISPWSTKFENMAAALTTLERSNEAKGYTWSRVEEAFTEELEKISKAKNRLEMAQEKLSRLSLLMENLLDKPNPDLENFETYKSILGLVDRKIETEEFSQDIQDGNSFYLTLLNQKILEAYDQVQEARKGMDEVKLNSKNKTTIEFLTRFDPVGGTFYKDVFEKINNFTISPCLDKAVTSLGEKLKAACPESYIARAIVIAGVAALHLFAVAKFIIALAATAVVTPIGFLLYGFGQSGLFLMKKISEIALSLTSQKNQDPCPVERYQQRILSEERKFHGIEFEWDIPEEEDPSRMEAIRNEKALLVQGALRYHLSRRKVQQRKEEIAHSRLPRLDVLGTEMEVPEPAVAEVPNPTKSSSFFSAFNGFFLF
jgi:hypothetical protein